MKTQSSPRPDLGDSIESLRIAVNEMDGYAAAAFNEIQAIASLVLVALESPRYCTNAEVIAHALGIIHARAGDAANAINCSAEAVGCNHTDDVQRRRWDARTASLEIERKAHGIVMAAKGATA
ncbi:hypothetical protein [Rhodoferax sp.]|uniref:hypothetical protein n=1 Tax=Rhodoferax sp. TaxID=50421 RepID=UPI0025D65204|nr:hypothetical protein [Rhodoferax sp.]